MIEILLAIIAIYAMASFISAIRRKDGQEAIRGLIAVILFAIISSLI